MLPLDVVFERLAVQFGVLFLGFLDLLIEFALLVAEMDHLLAEISLALQCLVEFEGSFDCFLEVGVVRDWLVDVLVWLGLVTSAF